MKKHLAKVLSVLMALTMVLGVFGPFAVLAQEADHNHNDEEHTCVFGEIVVDELTCDVNGNIVDGCIYRECTVDGCDKRQIVETSLKDAIDKYLGVDCREHAAYTYEITKAPDCENDGEATYTCSVCGKGFGNGQTKIPVEELGHAWAGWTTVNEADCTNDGLKTNTCNRCGEVDEEIIPATNHGITQADPNGNYGKINPAIGCGCALKVTDYPKPAGAPANFAWTIEQAPKCYQDGWVFEHCTDCHHVRKVDLKAGDDAHNWKLDDSTSDPDDLYYEVVKGSNTCISSTVYFKICVDCGYKCEERAEIAGGHTWESRTTTAKEGVAKDKGWKKVESAVPCDPASQNYYVRECTVCGTTEKVDYYVAQHKNHKYVCTDTTCVKVNGNCVDCTHADRELVCGVCGKDATDAHNDLHNWVDDNANDVAATCTTNKIEAYKCNSTKCTATKTVETPDSNIKNPTRAEHHSNWDVYPGSYSATCLEEGKEIGVCLDCQSGFVEYKVAKTGHKNKLEAAGFAQTCKTAGKKDHLVCEWCGITTQEPDVIPPDGVSHYGELKYWRELQATCVVASGKLYVYADKDVNGDDIINPDDGDIVGCGHPKNVITGSVAPNNHVKYTYDDDGNIIATDSMIASVGYTAPTCTTAGMHAYNYCEGCKVVTAVTTPSGHIGDVDVNCTSAEHAAVRNLVTRKAKVTVQNTLNILAIDALGHNFPVNPQTPTKAETCVDNGHVAEWYCVRCADPANDFYFYKDMATNDKYYEAGKKYDKHVIAPHGFDHITENIDRVYADCDDTGLYAGKFCSLCKDDTPGVDYCSYCVGKNYVEPAKGHNIQVHVDARPATIGAAGYVTYKCTDCDDQVLGNETLRAGSKPSYTEKGVKYLWYADSYAAPLVCEHTTYVADNKAPTCEEEGYNRQICNVCGEEKADSYETVPALGHKDAAGYPIYLGCQTYTTHLGTECVTCGYKAGEHLYHNLTFVRTGATCELAEDAHVGGLYYECSDCGVKVDMVWYEAFGMGVLGLDYGYLPATGFMAPGVTEAMSDAEYVSTVSFTPATSTAAGTWVWNCVCGDKHTTSLAYEYGMTLDLTVAPYTTSEIESELNFVNNGLVEVVISATAEDVAVKALSYKLGYNSALLSFVGAELVYEGDFETPIVGDNDGNVTILTTPKTGVDSVVITGESVPMFKYIFKLSEGATSIPADTFTLYDPEFDSSVKVTVENNNLTEAIDVDVMGDLTGDDKVTIDDLVAFRALINANGYNVAADFNNDGWVDFMDLIAINNFLVSNKTVADYYAFLGIDLDAAIAAYDYSDCDGDGDADIADLNEFKTEINNILATNSVYTYILGASNLNTIFANAAANAKVNP